VIIGLGFSPDQSRQINHLFTGRSFGEGQKTSVVRVMDNDYATIYRTLDRGTQGIVVPHVAEAAGSWPSSGHGAVRGRPLHNRKPR
jgi:2-keto-3-deoxy-L-rhamnonate aldolase RhmA